MKHFPRHTAPALVAALAVACLATWLLVWRPFSPVKIADRTFLRLVCASAGPGTLNVSLDEGHGFFVDRSAEHSGPLVRDPGFVTIEAPLPPGRVRELRIEADGAPEFRIQSATLHTESGKVLAQIDIRKLRAGVDSKVALHESFIALKPGHVSGAASVIASFSPPLLLRTGSEPPLWKIVLTFVAAFVASLVALRFGARLRVPNLAVRFAQKARAYPRITIVAVALASTVLNTYPIVFLGKSLVSPNTLAYLLYCGEPTIPNAPHEPLEHGAGSDLGAMMWQNLPYSVVESNALFRDHELPLWNRYNSSGTSLLGQGLSMFGDPLHCLPLLAGGAWWAWDLKFLLAKALFAIGIGLCAWSLTRRLGASALIAASILWIGFFVYRYNHPGYFSLCYAPWILLPWLSAKSTSTTRNRWLLAAALALADWMELSSGTVKESAMLLIGLNGTGLLMLVMQAEPWRARLLRIWPMLWVSVLFLLLSAPAWLLFLDSLRQAVTVYDAGRAFQLQPSMLIAFFDAIFSQDFTRHERVTQPSLNFLILAGLLWSIFSRRQSADARAFRAVEIVAIITALFVFGIVPPSFIIALPFIGKIEHIYNAFGLVLVVLLPLLAARGFALCAEPQPTREWRATGWKICATITALFLVYCGFTQAQPLSSFAAYKIESLLHSRFYLVYVPALILATGGLILSMRWMRRPASRFAAIALCGVAMVVLHFRAGMYVDTKFDPYVMNPRTGVELYPTSPAISYVKRAITEPARVYGFAATLAPGYNSVMGLEGIGGPDALHNPYYQELLLAAGVRQVWEWRWVIDPETVASLRPVYDMLNLRFYLREIEGASPELPGLKLAGRADLEVYESPTVWPRAYFVDRWSQYNSAAEFGQMVKHGDGRPFAALQREAGENLPASSGETGGRNIARAHEYRLTNNSTEFSVSASSAGLVVLGETYEKDNFTVTVNGEAAEVVRVNHAFKGVFVPHAGEYRIHFEYQPRMLMPAFAVSVLGALLACVTALVALRGFRLRQTSELASPSVLDGKPILT